MFNNDMVPLVFYANITDILLHQFLYHGTWTLQKLNFGKLQNIGKTLNKDKVNTVSPGSSCSHN